MSEYLVTYLHTDGSIRKKYVDATSKDSAREHVYSHTDNCVKTLDAVCQA